MATVLPSATPRQEVQLQQENVRQQSKIYELERRIAEQDEAIKRLDFSRPVEGGTSSMHLVQAAAHLGQAFTVALRGATHLCSLDRCRCCAKPAPQRPVSPDLAEKSEVRKKQVEEHRKRVTIVPGFRTTSDKVAPGTFGGAMTALEVGGPHLPPLNPVGGLKEHEYVHEDEWWRAGCVINPKERWKENWDMSILFFILYSAIVVPFRICFSAEADGQMWNFEVAVSIFFLIDVCFNFNTAYNIEDKWVISRKRIICRYLSGWFWIDAPSSLPVELLTALMPTEGTDNSSLGLLRFLRMFRLLRLLKLLKVDKYVSQVEDQFEVNLVSLRVLGMIVRLVFMVHMLGCFWFYVAAAAEAAGYEATWVTVYDGGSAHGGTVHTQYIYAVYWSLTTLTTVGYGDITPQNMPERYYCLFAMLIGAMMFGYMMSTIGSMVTTMDRQAANFEEKMDQVKEWMVTRNIPRKLLIRVRAYYEHYYTRKSAFDEEDIVRGLTPSLRAEVTSILLRDSLGHFPLFNMLGIDFQQEVYPRLKPVSYANQDVVYPKGSISEDIFFLRKGCVDVLAGGPGTNILYRLNPGQYFGEEALTKERRCASIIANGWCEMWSLSREVLDETVEKFPDLQHKLEQYIIADISRKSRLHNLSYRILISIARDPEKRAALVLQKAYTHFAATRARSESRFAAMFAPDGGPRSTKNGTRRSSSRSSRSNLAAMPAHESSSEGMAATLRQIQQQLTGLKSEMQQLKAPGPTADCPPSHAASSSSSASGASRVSGGAGGGKRGLLGGVLSNRKEQGYDA